MGQLRTYICDKCQYSAEASGKTEVTMLAVLQPYICNNCNELVMVDVGRFGKIKKPQAERTCPECGLHTIESWQPKKRLCPKCKTGKMEIDPGSAVQMID